MDYKEFFSAFYIGIRCTGLSDCNSKASIAETLLTIGLEDYNENVFPTSDEAYKSWWSEKSQGPSKAVWNTVKKIFAKRNLCLKQLKS